METTDQEIPDPLWMLESDFIQEGGQAEAIEDEPETSANFIKWSPIIISGTRVTVPDAWPALSSSRKVRG